MRGECLLRRAAPQHLGLLLKGSNGVGFSDATRGRLSDADRCLASEKRSSGKSRGWSCRIVCDYGDLGTAGALHLTVRAWYAGVVRANAARFLRVFERFGRLPKTNWLILLVRRKLGQRRLLQGEVGRRPDPVIQSIFRYSRSCFTSAGDRSSPNRCPPFP